MMKKCIMLLCLVMCSCQKESQWQTDASYIEVRYPSGAYDTYVDLQYSYLGYKEEKENQILWIKCVTLREDMEMTRKYIGCTYKVERKTQEDEK